MENKICPLFCAALDEGYDIHCQGERCAWYVQGGCAVQCLATLPDLVQKVGQL